MDSTCRPHPNRSMYEGLALQRLGPRLAAHRLSVDLPGLREVPIFFGTLAAYLALGWVLAGRGILQGDAYSRVEIAQRILFSNDPHLAAIGFVWGPLPEIALLPIVALKPLVPMLTTTGFATNIISALCMAGAAQIMYLMLRGFTLSVVAAVVLTAAFAAHPLIIFFGANGMSEAMLLLFLLGAAYFFREWIRDASIRSQVYMALCLAAAYLTRYEAVAACAAVAIITLIVSFRRAKGPTRSRLEASVADVTIACGPAFLAFVLWAVVSAVVTGQPFEQFSSAYGNSAQIRALGLGFAPRSVALLSHVAQQLAILEPAVPVAIAGGILAAVMRRRLEVIAPLLMLGVALVFMVEAEFTGAVQSFMRYLILVVPTAVLGMAALLVARDGNTWRRLMLATSCIAFAATMVASAVGVSSVPLDGGDAYQVRAAFGSTSDGPERMMNQFVTERQIAHDVDAMKLPPGSVLMDDFLGFAVAVNSLQPDVFVITSDRNFPSALADPSGSGCTYVLVPKPTGPGTLDALNRQYPDLYANGAGLATLVKDYPHPGGVSWRLYRVAPAP
jgi:hypothetical protein